MLIVSQLIILAAVTAIILITLSLNTKSEGLGAAITGASDTYRGAVGVEEQKRRLLQFLCYFFIVASLILTFLETYFL